MVDRQPTPSRRGRRAPSVVLAATVVTFAAGVGGCGGDGPHEYVGYRAVESQVVGDLSLPDATANGAEYRFDPEPGHVQVVYFGYTSCPDVCPTTLAAVRNALRDVDDADRVEIAMVTVDPGRDSSTVLTRYVQSFVPAGHALRTTDSTALDRVADAFGATYSVEVDDDGAIEVAHSGAMFVVAPGGSVTLTWPFGVTADDIASDLTALLDEIEA